MFLAIIPALVLTLEKSEMSAIFFHNQNNSTSSPGPLGNGALRADVSKYRPEVYKSEKSKILKKIHKVALGKILT